MFSRHDQLAYIRKSPSAGYIEKYLNHNTNLAYTIIRGMEDHIQKLIQELKYANDRLRVISKL